MEIDEKLAIMILGRTAAKPNDLSSARLYHDLNIYGDEADELLAEYARTFNVDLEKFDFGNYFPAEGDRITGGLLRWLSSRRLHFEELTVADMQDGIAQRKLPTRQKK